MFPRFRDLISSDTQIGVSFPVTPHLRGSYGTYDDTFMDEATTRRVLASDTIVQEKIDGINLGMGLGADGLLVLIRKDRIMREHELGLIPGLLLWCEWCEQHWPELRQMLATGLVLFGEYVPPALPVTHLPSWLLFDGYERRSGRFLAQAEIADRTRALPLTRAPILYRGVLGTLETVASLIGWSVGSDSRMEGVYLRIEDGQFLKERYKFVRHDFVKE